LNQRLTIRSSKSFSTQSAHFTVFLHRSQSPLLGTAEQTLQFT
jgi:hypothetical protein